MVEVVIVITRTTKVVGSHISFILIVALGAYEIKAPHEGPEAITLHIPADSVHVVKRNELLKIQSAAVVLVEKFEQVRRHVPASFEEIRELVGAHFPVSVRVH